MTSTTRISILTLNLPLGHLLRGNEPRKIYRYIPNATQVKQPVPNLVRTRGNYLRGDPSDKASPNSFAFEVMRTNDGPSGGYG